MDHPPEDRPKPSGPPWKQPPDQTPPPEARETSTTSGARGADVVLVVASGLFLVATLLPWYRVSVGAVSASKNAWGSQALGVLAGLAGLGLSAVAVAAVTGSVGPGPRVGGLLAIGLSTAAFVFTLLRALIRPPGSSAAEELTGGLVHVSRGIGLWAALGFALAATIAGFWKYRQNPL